MALTIDKVISAGTTVASLGDVVLSNSNGISFGANGQTITASHNGLTSQSNQAVSAANGSYTFQTLSFSDANGISFGTSAGSAVTASYTVPTVTNSSWTVSDAVTSATVGRLAFTNSNGLTLSLSTSNNGNHTVIGSYTVPTVTNSSWTVSDAVTSQTIGRLAFTNANGLTMTLSTSNNGNATVFGSYTVPTITSWTISDAVTSQTIGRLAFTNSNGLTMTLSTSNNGNATVIGSHNGITSQSNQDITLYAIGNTTQNSSTVLNASNLSFNGIGSITVGYSNGSIQLSAANALTSQSNQAFSAGAASSTFQTLSFQDSNGVSFSNNAGAIRVTHDLQFTSNTSAITSNALNTSVSRVINIVAATNNTGGGTASLSSNVSFSNANNFTFYTSAGNAVVASFNNTNLAGTGFTSGGANISLSGTLNSNGLSLSASVAPPGAAAENNWVNLLGANTAGNTTASGSTIGYSGINLTLSGTNGSVVNISAPATSSLSGTGGVSISINGSTISIGGQAVSLSNFHHPENVWTSLGAQGQGSLSIKHMYVPFNVTGTAMKIGGSISGATNTSATTASCNLSLWMGIYTLNGSTLSLASSGSANNGFQWSQSASTTGNTSINSMRALTVPININMTPGEYWVAAVISSATTYTSAGITLYGGNLINNAATAANFAPIGSGTTASSMAIPFQGIYTAATSEGPVTISKANVNWTSASNVVRANFYNQIINNTY